MAHHSSQSTVRRRPLQRRRVAGSPGLAIDIGTGHVRIATPQRVLLDEPSVIAYGPGGAIVAVGASAHGLIGRSPADIEVVRPILGSAIVNLAAAERLLAELVVRHGVRSPSRHEPVVVAVPCVANELERRALLQCVAGVFHRRRLLTIDTPVAAAIGADLAVHQPLGTLVVDVGCGSTEGAMISLGAIVVERSAAVGSDAAVSAVIDHLERAHGLQVGHPSAERLIRDVSRQQPALLVRGVHRRSGLPEALELGPDEIRAAIAPVLDEVAAIVASLLDASPAPLAVDVMEHGITLTGAAATLDGLAARVATSTGLPVAASDAPSRAVIDGARHWLRHPLDGLQRGISC